MYSLAGGADRSIYPENYVHCDGTQLRLTDSDYGSEQFTASDYYVWIGNETRSHQLLFIFPTRVNLTNITLHYYSDSDRGLPRLTFRAVPDNFNIWDSPPASNSHVEVATVGPNGEPTGQRNLSISFSFMTKKILLYKYRSAFNFAMSEIEFFNDSCSTLKTNSLTRDSITASHYKLLYVTEIMSATSRTPSKSLVNN